MLSRAGERKGSEFNAVVSLCAFHDALCKADLRQVVLDFQYNATSEISLCVCADVVSRKKVRPTFSSIILQFVMYV